MARIFKFLFVEAQRRASVLFLAVLLSGVTIWLASSAAQPPNRGGLALPPNTHLPKTIILQSDPAIESQIKSAIRGGVIPEATDPILEGMLDVLKERGSILDGSVLDRETEPPKTNFSSDVDARARAAELLLRASRILGTINPIDDQRSDLIEKMRAESARLLSQASDNVKIVD